jgi:hypothetical protein
VSGELVLAEDYVMRTSPKMAAVASYGVISPSSRLGSELPMTRRGGALESAHRPAT